VAGLLVLEGEAAPLGLQVNLSKMIIQHIGNKATDSVGLSLFRFFLVGFVKLFNFCKSSI